MAHMASNPVSVLRSFDTSAIDEIGSVIGSGVFSSTGTSDEDSDDDDNDDSAVVVVVVFNGSMVIGSMVIG